MPQTELSLWSKLKYASVDIGLKSTIHAIPNILGHEKWSLKIVWMICFVTSAAICITLIFNDIFEYLEYDVVTTVTINYDAPAPFPQVIICNIEPITTNLSLLVQATVMDLVNISQSDLMSQIYNQYDDFKYVYLTLASYSMTQQGKLRALGASLDQMVLKCTFANLNCSPNDWRWIYHPTYGNCFKFNHNSTYFPIKAGRNDALNVELYLSPATKLMASASSIGARVYIQNGTDSPDFSSEGLDVAAGTDTSISLSRTFSTRLSQPYSACLDSSNIVNSFNSKETNYFRDNNMIYTIQTCFEICYRFRLVKTCHCYDSNYPDPTRSSVPCLNNTQMGCVLDFIGRGTQTMNSYCSKQCPLECDTMNFDHSISFSSFPSYSYATSMLQAKPQLEYIYPLNNGTLDPNVYEDMKRGLVSIRVYYETMFYTLVEEIPAMTLTSLIANVGGFLGLFLGLSFLTLVELFDLAIQASFILASHFIVKPKIEQNAF